jgi:hypothetical protein
MQENNEVGEKFLEWGRVLDFAVCLRLLVVEERFVSGGDDEWIAVGLTPEILRFTQDDRVLVDDRDFVGWITSCRHGAQRCCDRRRWR